MTLKGVGAPAPPRAGPVGSRTHLALTYASGGFGLAMNAMIQFLLPLRADELGASLGLIGLLVGSKAVVEALVSVPLGRVIDRIGPRRAFILGTLGTAVTALAFTAVTTPLWLLPIQAVLGVVRPLAWVGSQTYVAGLASGAEGAAHTGRFSFASSSGQMVAPLAVGAVASVLGFRAAFVVLTGYALVFTIIGLLLPDLPRATASGDGKRAGSFRDAVHLLAIRGIRVAMALTFVRLWVSNIWTAFYPLHLVNNGIDTTSAGAVVSAMAVTATVITLSAGRLTRRLPPAVVTAAALGIGSVGLGISPFLVGVPASYVPAAMIGIGLGLSLPLLITIVGSAVEGDQRGLALGLRSSVNQIGASSGPVIVAGLIEAMGITAGFPMGAGVALAVLAIGLTVNARGRQLDAPPTSAASTRADVSANTAETD